MPRCKLLTITLLSLCHLAPARTSNSSLPLEPMPDERCYHHYSLSYTPDSTRYVQDSGELASFVDYHHRFPCSKDELLDFVFLYHGGCFTKGEIATMYKDAVYERYGQDSCAILNWPFGDGITLLVHDTPERILRKYYERPVEERKSMAIDLEAWSHVHTSFFDKSDSLLLRDDRAQDFEAGLKSMLKRGRGSIWQGNGKVHDRYWVFVEYSEDGGLSFLRDGTVENLYCRYVDNGASFPTSEDEALELCRPYFDDVASYCRRFMSKNPDIVRVIFCVPPVIY